jgi:predicted RNA-binding Zn ribbon-like protein
LAEAQSLLDEATRRPVEAAAVLARAIAFREALYSNRFTWQWAGSPQALDRMLWDVARSSIDLLTSDDLPRVGQCADERGCGWLFLDMSRNHSRQWCNMGGCGNRAKARRHYSKVKAQQDV